MCYGWLSVRWGKVIKEGLEANHANRHWGEIRKMMERMKYDNEKRMTDAIERARDKILYNGSAVGTNDAVPDLSMPIPIS